MAPITVPGMFLTGDHASRPAASAVGGGSLYSCTDHDLIYQSDTSSWTTWATVGGGGGITVEDEGTPLSTAATTLDFTGAGVTASGSGASKTINIPGGGGGGTEHHGEAVAVLTNATSTGDSGGRADTFTGTSIGGAWTTGGSSFASAAVKYSVYSIAHATAGGGYSTQAYTPSGAFRVECHISGKAATSSGFGLLIKDNAGSDASGDAVIAWLDGTDNAAKALTIDSGSFNERGSSISIGNSANGIPLAIGTRDLYLAIERNGSNAWTVQISLNRVTWQSIVSGHSKTFTVARFGLRTFGTTFFYSDWVDVVS